MSPNISKNVAEIVEKFRADYPNLESAKLRKIIRLANPELFKEDNPYYEANKQQLTRCLRKSFKSQLLNVSNNTKEGGPSKTEAKNKHKLGFFDRIHLAETKAIDQEILMIERKGAARKEIAHLPPNIKGLARIEKEHEIKRKYGLL